MPTRVKYCLIPADDSVPVEEREFEEDPSDQFGGFTKCLNAHYSRSGAKVDVNVLREQVSAHAKEKGTADPSTISDDMFQRLALSQTVDIVPLMPALPSAGWTGVNMYVDDKGIPKNLPLNARATQLSAACGIPTQVRGDAFIARLRDDQNDIFERMDFTMSELSADAPWAVAAKCYNDERSARGPTQIPKEWTDNQGGGPQSAGDPEELFKSASEHRAAGTASFKAGDYASAANAYHLALHALSGIQDASKRDVAAKERLTVNLNLASACLHIEEPYEAIKACDEALELDSSSVKAWYRRGLACIKINQYSAAKRNLHRAAELEPNNREIREAYEKCKRDHRARLEAGAGLILGEGSSC